jgi:glycerol uptake facilitator-like aquaporin
VFSQANNEPIYTALIIGVLICAVILPVMGISGGMFNPILATVLFAGCKGHSMAEHIYIYWVGALGGSILAFLVYPTIKNSIYPAQATKQKTN